MVSNSKSNSSKYRPLFMMGVFIFITSAAQKLSANRAVQKLLDSYLIAKTETLALTDDELKKTPYTIQVASYINEKDAASHVEELRIQEKAVRYFPVFVRNQIWYKVCVGLFDTKEEAESYKKLFMQRVDEPFSVVISMFTKPEKISIERATASSTVAETEVPISKQANAKQANKKSESFYSLQVGAFPEEKIAMQRVTDLSIKEQPTEIRSAVVNGKTWYRVFIGRFQSKKEAKNFQHQFSQRSPSVSSFIRQLSELDAS